MAISSKKETLFLFLGDLVCFSAALWLTLLVRHGELPSVELWYAHLKPFSVLFVFWVIAFFIAGLYERHTLLLRGKFPMRLLNAQLGNTIIAVLFFYFVPVFGINPKTNLFIYLVISSLLIFAWRLFGRELLPRGKRELALLIGGGEEVDELEKEINGNPRYQLRFSSSIDLQKLHGANIHAEIMNRVFSDSVSVIVADFKDEKIVPILPHLYNLLFSHIRFIDIHHVYEDTFGRVPLSLLNTGWFLENISIANSVYDATRRLLDMVIASIAGLFSLLVYPFVYCAIKFDDGGDMFINQERVGKNNQLIRVIKFRSMSGNDSGNYGSSGRTDLVVTSVGKFLRKWRVDELPQLWNVLRGDLSLIGPRPEFAPLVMRYEKEIPYYGVRHLVKPGLSGWAQVHHERHPHHGIAVDQTKEKLSYDLYYIKNRSLLLDLKILLKTVKTILSRSGM